MSKTSKVGFSPEILLQYLPPLAEGTCLWVAYSGGCDSHVLLHALARLDLEIELKAVHINHGLSAQADEWAQHCQHVCNELAIPLTSIKVDATPLENESPEEAARRARYRAITELLKKGDFICTAHHQDDQAETLLLQLLRGAGPKGLAAMGDSSSLGKAILLRPLLSFSRAQLQTYAESQGLKWVDDSSNFDTGFDRNYLRHKIMPALQQRWPAAPRTLSRSAEHCADATELLEDLAWHDLAQIHGDTPDTVVIDSLLMLTPARQRNVLRHWLHQLGLPLPSGIKLQHIFTDVIPAAKDRQPCIHWPGAEVRRFNGRLYAMPPLPEFDATQIIPWDDLGKPLLLPDGRQLVCKPTDQRPALNLEKLQQGKVTVRFRQGGEACQPVGSQHHKLLKQLQQERHIPPWQRTRQPLIFVDDCLASVTDICFSKEMLSGDTDSGCMISYG